VDTHTLVFVAPSPAHWKSSGMKSFASPSFFRLFDLLLSATNPGLKLTCWAYDGVAFERERHSFTGPKHAVTIEIFTLTRAGRRGWSLMVTKEYWWAGAESRAFKNLRWARPLSGQRGDLLNWLRTQEAALERSSSLRRASARIVNPDSPADPVNDTEEILNLEGNGRSATIFRD
jgi:hypothetical protein